MTIDNGGEAAVVEAAPEAAVSSQQGRDYEAEARDQGWRPQDEWTGKPDNWKDAKTWVEHGDLRSNIRNEVRAEFEGRFANLEKMSKKAQTVIKQGYEAQIADLKEGRNAAIKSGNTALADKYETAIDQTKDAAKDDGESPVEENVNAAFKKKNPWYGDDDDLTAMAIVQSNAVSQAYTLKHGKPMPDAEMLEAVERKVKASPEYKAKFGDKPAANGHATVDGGSESPGAAPKTNTMFAKLPPEAKAQCAKDVKAGVYKTNEEWAQAYFS
jgi:hypothetical protein